MTSFYGSGSGSSTNVTEEELDYKIASKIATHENEIASDISNSVVVSETEPSSQKTNGIWIVTK